MQGPAGGARRRYAQMTEEALEDAYSQYLHRQGQRDAATRRRARLAAKPKRGDPNAAEGGSDGGTASDSEAEAAAALGGGAPDFDAPDQVDSDVSATSSQPGSMSSLRSSTQVPIAVEGGTAEK